MKHFVPALAIWLGMICCLEPDYKKQPLLFVGFFLTWLGCYLLTLKKS